MHTTTISLFTKSPSAYLKQAVAGEEVLITDNGHPIARLLPVAGEGLLHISLGETADSDLINSEASPIPEEFWELPRPADAQAAVRTSVLRERQDSW